MLKSTRILTLFAGLFFLLSFSVLGQSLSEEEKKNLLEIAKPISFQDNFSNGNWESFGEAIEDKRLVFLGEFNHGNREVFLARNDLIKYLHEEHGFDLILFESGFGELYAINQQKKSLSSKQLTEGFFYGWRTSEFAALMKYAQENEITVAGFDVQRTGSTFTQFVEIDSLKEIETEFVRIKSLLSNRRTQFDSIAEDTEALLWKYRYLKKDADNPWIARTFENRIQYLTYMLEWTQDRDWSKRWKARDVAMATNVQWILNQFDSDQKAIIVGHNFHISRFSEKESVMGEFLHNLYGQESFILGVFAASGSFANNSGQPELLSAPADTTLDIKHIALLDGAPVTFLPFGLPNVERAQWIWKPITVNDTFIDLYGTNSLELIRHFDGLLLFDEVSTPIR